MKKLGSAPTAQQFMNAEGQQPKDHENYINFAERYGDFIAEFERKDGVLENVTRWPSNDPSKNVL